jgi:glutamine cyclotransferase
MSRYIYIICILFTASCNNSNNTNESENISSAPIGILAPVSIPFNITAIYPHDTSAYTQGLEIFNGKLYEGTGDYINSSIRIAEIKTGKVVQKHMMGTAEIFGEGITIFKDKIYQLTWKNHLINVYDIKNINQPIKTFNWPYEGWGITHNDTELIISDGSANLYFVKPEDCSIKTTKQITDNIGPIKLINELELIDGYIFANVYGSEYIIKIDPSNGHVVGNISLPGLIKQYAKEYQLDEEEVLNGIAWDSTTKKIYITGKRWPKVFEMTVN